MSSHLRHPSRISHHVSPLVAMLQRLGFLVGAMSILTVPSRQSGILRSTAVPLLTVDGRRYIVADYSDADWVRDVCATGRGILDRGHREKEVTLVELPVSERAPILREVPRLVPGLVTAFQRRYGVAADAESFARLAPFCPVFVVGEG